MKTTILLDLSQTGVRLLQDAGPEPTVLGVVALDDPAFDSRIAELRAHASGAGEVIVLVPHTEILFFDLAPARGGDEVEDAAIRAALDGRTPYPLADLVFDWRRRQNGRIAVAAVARETLEEADAFAVAQGFTPTRHGSLPEPLVFGAAADFGLHGARASAAPGGDSDPVSRSDPTSSDAPAAQPVAPDRPAPEATSAKAAPDRVVPPAPMAEDAAPPPLDSRRLAARAAVRPDLAAGAQRGRATPPKRVTRVAPAGLTARDLAAGRMAEPRLSLPSRPDGAEAPAARPARRSPPARHPSRPPGRSAAAMALAALVWTGFHLLGPDKAELASAPDAPAAGPEAAETEGPRAGIAPDRATDAAPGPSPEDPLNRPADAPEADRYAATGIVASPPAGPAAPRPDRSDDLPVDLLDPERGPAPGLGTLAPLMTGEPEQPPAPLVSPDASGGADADATAAQDPATSGPESDDAATAEGPDAVEQDGAPGPALTPEGTISPAGIRVVAGTPPVAPPPAPDRAATPATSTDQPAPDLRPETRPEAAGPAADEPDAAAAETPELFVRRAEDTLRPLARPDAADLAAPADLAARDEAIIADLAPRPRPQDAAPPDATTEPVPAVVDSAAVAAAAARALEEPLPELEPSPYAVARSLSPETRPQDLAREAAAPVEVTTAASVVTPRAATPSGTSERATLPDGLTPGRMNLIGVYGSESNRRALVRLPSGRFAKVKVGDRVDGGRIRAIGSGDLSYVKSGRSITLQMPDG